MLQDPQPPKKQQKKAASSSSSKSKSDDNEFSWSLDKNRQVTVREFKGKVYVDIREFYLDNNGDLKPGKKGISLSAPQYQKLKGLIGDIDDALKKF